MILSSIELAKIMSPHAREELLIEMAKYFPRDENNIKAIAKRSKVARISAMPAPTDQEIAEAKAGKMSNFFGLYRNRVNEMRKNNPASIEDVKEVYDMIKENL